MRQGILGLASAGALVLAGDGALADTWTVLEGRLTDAETGETRPLSGEFDGWGIAPDPDAGPAPTTLYILDFAFEAGGLELAPARSVEFEGQVPIAWNIVFNPLQFEDDRVTDLRLRSGGELVAVSEDQVTFHFLELRADASDGGHAIGRIGDTGLPRRLELEGALVEVLQSFAIRDSCSQSPPGGGGSPGGGGGGVVIGSGGAILSSESFEIGGRRTFLFQAPTGSAAITARSTGPVSTLDGELSTGGSQIVMNPAGVVYDSSFAASPLSVSATPTLEELGIRAPDGAEVTLDAAGALVVRSTGDLFVEGTLPESEIPGLTSVTLTTTGRIVVTGAIRLPGLRLNLSAGQIDGTGTVDLAPVGTPVFCNRMRPILPAEEHVLGTFSLVATAARPVEVDVMPGDARNRLRPGSRGVVPVALYGSPDLDVRDVLPRSLRLGDGEAKPIVTRGGPRVLRARLNRDRYPDLVAFFRVRDAEVAFGDSALCLFGETRDGELLEGCDAIDTRPGRAAR